MKTIILQVCFLLLYSNSVLEAQELISIKHSCSFDEEETDQEFYYFGASSEADKIVLEIVDAVSIAKNFVVKSSNCKNALAAVENGERYIFYNTSFLEKFKKDARTKWAAYCVLAHEIGHHLNFHDFKITDPKLRKKMELQADVFAGGVLQKLGATLEEAKAGIDLLQNNGESHTHPNASARAEAIASGWKKSQDNARRVNPEPTPSPIVREKEKKPIKKTEDIRPIPEPEPDDFKPVVSDLLLVQNLIGTWQLDLGYNAYGQYVIIQSALFSDGSMSAQTFLNGVVSATEYSSWAIQNGVMVVMDQAGYFYYYAPAFNGNDMVIMTFTGSTGASIISVGTQLYYTRVR